MRKKIGIIFISLFCFAAVAAWLLSADETMAADAQEMSCVIGDANYSGVFEVGDLVRLKRHLKTTELECSMDGDLDVSGDLASADVVRCREMLVGDSSLQVSVAKEDWYKKLKDTDGYYAYYKLNKSLKAGWTLTFKVDFKNNTNCSVYGYYPGCDEWIYIGDQGDQDSRLRLIAEQDIPYLNIRVANADNQTEISEFRVYDIEVYKEGCAGAVKNLAITYNQSTDMPVVYGTSDTLDLTKFGVQTNEKNLSYKWTIKQTGVENTTTTLDMTDAAYEFSATGNYTLTATVNTTGYSGSVSTKIMVVNPAIYVGFDGGAIKNTGTASNTVGAYAMDALNNATSFVPYSGTVNYGTGINGDASGAIVTTHYDGPYTIVKNYAFGTSNFTVSAWINVPKDAQLSSGSTTYLFGTMNPDGEDGFALSLKEGELRVKVLDNTANMPAISFERDSWYNITVKREGTSFKFYFDGEMVKEYTISKTDTFGTKDLAFGAYHGFGDNAYKIANMLYDDIQIYSGSLGDATIAALAAVDTVGPDVAISFDNGKIENTGMDTSITASAKKLSAESGETTTFEDYKDAISYGTGVNGEQKGAILTNHRTGPYTVTSKAYPFGEDDFTVSAWFKIPSTEEMSKSGTYIFGTANPDDQTTGFSVCIKYENSSYQVRLRHGSTTSSSEAIDFKFDEWYHIALRRDDNNLRVYLNGDILRLYKSGTLYNEVSTSVDFGEAVLAVGGCNGWKNAYKDADMYFDNVEIYGSAVATKYIKEAYDSADEPQVHINYTDSTVANTGADTDAVVGTYKMDAVSHATMFQTEPAVPYTMGAAYDKGGAISTNHYDGVYTVVRDYVFGTNDFTVSAWVKVPKSAEVASGAGTYLFGIDHVDTTEGFSVSLKASELRIKLPGTTWFTSNGGKEISFEKGQWYHVALTREGATMKVYFDGSLVDTKTDALSDNYNFGAADLAFGGYYGAGALKDANTHFDEIKVYNGVLSADEIASVADTALASEDLILDTNLWDESALIKNEKLFYRNDKDDDKKGQDPGCIYVTEGEYAGQYITYFNFKGSTQVKCLKSQDLTTWETADSKENRCFSPDLDSSWISGNIWAPEVIYNEEDGKYYMFYSATKDNSENNELYKCLGLAISDSPIGPFTDIGDPLFDGAKLNGEPGFIDAHPFVDPETGDKYLYMARTRYNHDTNIVCVVKMTDWKTPDYSTYKELTTVDRTTYNGSEATERVETGLSGDPVNEAPQVLYHKGTYYLTMSICGTTEEDYTVIQATGTSPTGPFTKVQQSKGGVLLGVDLDDNYAWDHISCSGSHSFIQAGDELFVLYHTHVDPYNLGEGANRGYDRILALERVVWTTNSDGQTIMKAAGPTTAVQPKPAAYSGYINLAPKATVTATSGSNVSSLNDGVVRVLSSDDVKQFEASENVTITMKFDEFVKARSLLIYNSWKYTDAFEDVSSVTFTYGKVVDGVRHIGTKTLTDASFNMTEYSYVNEAGTAVMIPGSALILTFDEMEIIEVSIEIPVPSGKSKVAISDIALLCKVMEEEADVHVNYNNGTMGYTSSDDAVTVGAKIISANSDKTATFNDYTGAFTFATGVDGDANGAIMTNHTYGPLTVVEGYDFGSNDFTVSTWFKVPSGETIQSSGNFIFGISDPDNHTSAGFSACIKYTEKDGYQWRFKDATSSGGQMVDITNFAFDKWYHIAVSREGSTLKWYVDGDNVYTQTAADFTSTTLAVGAYAGWGNSYKNTDMYFDELRIYGSALSQEKIAALTAEYKN